MVRETRYLIVRNLPENCTEETVIDHFQRYGKIQSVKLQAAKDNDSGSTATVAFNDIKSAAKAHHAKNSLGEVTLRTDYWEGSTSTPVIAPAPVATSNAVRSAIYTTVVTAAPTRPVSAFPNWTKGTEEEGSALQDKGESTPSQTSGVNTPSTATSALEKLSSTPSFDRGRTRERFTTNKKKFGKFENRNGSFGRHGTTTSSRSLEAARSQSEAAAAAAAAASSATPAATTTTPAGTGSNSNSGSTTGLNPIIVSDTRDCGNKDAKENNKDSTLSRPHSVASPSSRHSGLKKSQSQSRSASRSRSRSHGSKSSSSRSDSSGTSRSTSPHRSYSSSTARPQSMVGASRLVSSEIKDTKREEDGERKPLGICITGLPMRSTDSSLRDGLYHEYKKHGKVTTVQICADGDSRCAIVSFKKPEDASKALEASQGKVFFGSKIKVTSHEGIEVDDSDVTNDNDSLDEYHLKSTRTLFVGNLEKETTKEDLIEKFQQFGEIIDVDIKRQGATTAFAFVQYVDITSVVAALRAMEGEHIGINKIKESKSIYSNRGLSLKQLGFGKSMPTCCVWVDNLPSDTNGRSLKNLMSRYGEITHCLVDKNRNRGLIYFNSYDHAQHCVSDIKMRPHFSKKKLQIDFASRECQTNFLDRMEESGQLRANERPDESRVHSKFRQQRSFDGFPEEGSPSSYGYNPRTPGSFSSRNGRSSRRGRQYVDPAFPEEPPSSRRSRRPEDFTPSSTYYSSKGNGDDYDAVLREYGHSQRERRERDSPRHSSADRRVDSQSRRGSRDHSLDRYEDRQKERTVDIFSNRGVSPSSEHNSYHSENRYRSSRDEKYLSRDRFEDRKSEDKDFDHHSRPSRTASPFLQNHASLHSHDSEFNRRGGSRSQSPTTPLQEEAGSRFYSDDYKHSVGTEDDYNPHLPPKRRDSESKSWLMPSNKLGAEVAKTVEKSRKRTHEESGLTDSFKVDSKVSRKLEKPSSLSEDKIKYIHRQLSGSKRMELKNLDHGSSPGSSESHGDSENGSASEGDLHHLHQEKEHILLKLQEFDEEVTSEPESPQSTAKVKSVAVKDALRHSGRSHEDKRYDEASYKSELHRRHGEKVRRLDSKRELRNHISDDVTSREDRAEKDETYEGNSDSGFEFDLRTKKRRPELHRDSDSMKVKNYLQESGEISEEEDMDRKSEKNVRIHNSSLDRRGTCDSRTNSMSSKFYDDSKVTHVSSPCDSSDPFKGGISDNDLSVITSYRTSSISNSHFPKKDWSSSVPGHESSPLGNFSPAYSEENTQDSVTSGSLTDKSSKHSPASPTGKDFSDNDLSYLKLMNSSVPECSSDDSMSDVHQNPGEQSVEERIRAIDEILNMTTSNKSLDSLHLVLPPSNITNNNDNSGEYLKFRIRKREGGIEGGNGSRLADKKPEPSVIMQQVLSKKSILDQDFRRLRNNDKFEPMIGKDHNLQSLALKTELTSPKLLDIKGELKQVSSYLSFSSSYPVTTSSSMLQPTITTSIASSVSHTAPISTSVLTSPIVSSPITISSNNVSTKTVAVDNTLVSSVLESSNNPVVFLSDKLLVSTNSLTLKQDVTYSSKCLLTLPNSSLTSKPVCGVVQCTSTDSIADSNLLSSQSSLQSSLSHQPMSSTLSTPSLLTSTLSSISHKQQAVSSLPATSCSSLSTVTKSPSGATVAAPFTQGPDKSQLTPTVGQEAPRLCSPSFTPENSRTSASSHLPGSRSPRITTHKQDDQHVPSNKPELTISVSGQSHISKSNDDLKGHPSLSKADVISPDIESPVSVKSETSSNSSVPLSSHENKAHLTLEEKGLISCISHSIQASKPENNNSVSLKIPVLSNVEEALIKSGKGNLDIPSIRDSSCDVGLESITILNKTDELSSKRLELSPACSSQVVLSVGSKDNSEKRELPSPTGGTSSCSKVKPISSSLSLNSEVDIPIVPVSSKSTVSNVASTSAIITSRPSTDRSEKKSGKSNSHSHMKSPAKSEALFAPDVKVELKLNEKTEGKHQSKDAHKSSSNSSNKIGASSSGEKKLPKLPSKEIQDTKASVTNKDQDKSEKKSDNTHKTSGHDSASKAKEFEKSKVKDKREHTKDGEKNKQKENEDIKKKDEKKSSAEKKDAQKGSSASTKEDKKIEKKVEDKKEKTEKSKVKEGSKLNIFKKIKSDIELGKKDKKQKPKDVPNKDKQGDKKLPMLSCITKNSTPEVKAKEPSKSETKDPKQGRNESKDLSAKDGSSKAESSTKIDQKTLSKPESKNKVDSKSNTKASNDLKSENKDSSSSLSKKLTVDSSKQKKNTEGSKQSLSKQDKPQSHKVKPKDDKLKEKQKLKEEKEKQRLEKEKLREEKEKEREKEKEKERQEREQRERDEKERQKEKEERERKELEEKERKEKEEKERKEKEERDRKEKEEREKKEREEKERLKREKEERERQKEKEREEREKREREERERKEREEKERLRKERDDKLKQKEEKDALKEKERLEKERQERERKEKEEKDRQKEKEEKEKLKEKEEKEKLKEKEEKLKEKEEKEKLKEKEEKEKLKEKEEKLKEKEEKEKLKEKEEKEKQKEKEEKEKQKDDSADKEKMKEKEKKDKERKEKEKKEKRDKEKKAKEDKLRKEKEERAKKEKDERAKKEEKEKAKKEKLSKKDKKQKSDKEKDDDDDKERKKPPPKKPKRNELAVLLDSNDRFQMTFTSMYDRVKTQRNREPEQQQKAEPAPKSSFDKFKQNRKKKGSKARSSLYSCGGSTSELSDDSDLSGSETSLKAEPVKETKPKKTSHIKKRPHVSSSSSSSCEEDDDALLRASKSKGKKTDKFSEIFSTDSEEDNFQTPSNKSKVSSKINSKPPPKRRKTRDGSSDSKEEGFAKPHAMSSVTEPDSLDDIDMSEDDIPKRSVKKANKTAKRLDKSSDQDKRESSVESVSKKITKMERESSVESVSKKSTKSDKEGTPTKKFKADLKKSVKNERDNENKGFLDGKASNKEDIKTSVTDKKKGKSLLEPSKEKKESKKESDTGTSSKKELVAKKDFDNKKEAESKKEFFCKKEENKKEFDGRKEAESKKDSDKKDIDDKKEAEPKRDLELKKDSESKRDLDQDKKASSTKEKEKSQENVNLKHSDDRKKKKDKDEGPVKKKKKKKYDPKEEEELVNSLITKVYDKALDKEKKQKKKSKPNIFDSDSDMGLSETSFEIQEEKVPVPPAKEKTDPEMQKQKEKKRESSKDKEVMKDKDANKSEKHPSKETKSFVEVSKKPDKKKAKELHIEKETEKTITSAQKKEKREKEKEPAPTDVKIVTGVEPEIRNDSQAKQPKKKKKKKDYEKDVDKEKASKSYKKSNEQKTESEKKNSENEKKASSSSDENSAHSSQVVDEFVSFWGHPKPILIPKRLKDTTKNDEDKTKSKDEAKSEGGTDKPDSTSKTKEVAVKEEKNSTEKPELVSGCDKVVKVESEANEDFVVPISEAETTVTTELTQAVPVTNSSQAGSHSAQEESVSVSEEDIIGHPDETTIGSSVEIHDDDDYPLLVIDEVSETVTEDKKKMTKKEKKLLKQQQEKERNDRMDEVIASVANAGSSDDEDVAKCSPVSLQIDSVGNDRELVLSDVINQELKYDNKMSNEPDSNNSIISDIVFPDTDNNKKPPETSHTFSGNRKDKKEAKALNGSTIKKEGEDQKHPKTNLLNEDLIKREDDLVKNLSVITDTQEEKPVAPEECKLSEEDIKKQEEEQKRKAEEEKKKLEEEDKARHEKEEQALKEASDEAARAVESILEFQSGFEQEPIDLDDDLPPLYIEPAEKEPPTETVIISPTKDTVETVTLFSNTIPEKLTANLDDKLLEVKTLEKGDQGENKIDAFSFFATPPQAVVAGFTSPRRNSATKDKTPEPVTMPSPQRQKQSPQRQIPPSPQIQSPQRQMPSPQRQMPSPQRQMQSPQRQMTSPQRIQSPQRPPLQSTQLPMQSPLRPMHSSQIGLQSPLQSPQRSPFFSNKDSKLDRSLISPNRDVIVLHDIDTPAVQQPQRRLSSGLSMLPTSEQLNDPAMASRTKSLEFTPEQIFHSPRRNTIAAPEEVASTHMDHRFTQHQGPNVIYPKERSHCQSSLPPPVSISLDNAPHDKNFQTPMRSLTIPPHQENVLLSPKKNSPGIHFKDIAPDPSLFPSQSNKGPLQEHLFQPSKTMLHEQLFAHHPKSSPQDQLFHSGKGPMHDIFKTGPSEQQVFFASKGPVPDKQLIYSAKIPESNFPFQKGQQQESLFPNAKVAQPERLQEPMFSSKGQNDSTYSYPEQPIDFLLNSPPPRNTEFIPYNTSTELPKPSLTKQMDNLDTFSKDPLFLAMETTPRHTDREPPQPRRLDGFPPSFYQEPVPVAPPKNFHENSNLQQQPGFDDDKKGSRKRKRNNKRTTKEDRAAALAEQQAIEQSVQANVESIHKALNANQAKAAAEKAVVGMDKKKAVDAYDFEAHTGQELGTPRIPVSEAHHASFGEDLKQGRTRTDRGRGRGSGTRRGRKVRGGLTSGIETPDAIHRHEPFSPQQPHLPSPPTQFQAQQNQEHLPSQKIPYVPFQFSSPPQQPSHPAFQRQISQPVNHQLQPFYQSPQPSSGSENSSSMSLPEWQMKQMMPPNQLSQTQQLQIPPQQQIAKPPPKNDEPSPEPSKQDLDSSFGESELVINLDDQPSSIEGKENQYSSDGEVPSPATPKTQRSRRARTQPNYKAIASGTPQSQIQVRSSRSGGSPRGRGIGAQSPKNSMSPRTRSSENVPSSSPVVKLEKLEVSRTTRRRKELVSKFQGKDEMSEEMGPTTSFEDWKAKKVEDNKTISKENVYEFVDNEQEQSIEPNLRTRARKKRASENQELQSHAGTESVSGNSPASSSNLQPGLEPPISEESNRALPLSNVDAVIDAVSKGIFGSSEDDGSLDIPLSIASESASTPSPVLAPPSTRSSRRSTELKKDAEQKEKTTFTIAEPSRFELRDLGKKGPTVPPLRIKVAHGTPKVEKNEEKHYVIERAIKNEHKEKPPLAFTVKLSDSGTATIKPAVSGNGAPFSSNLAQIGKSQVPDGTPKKENHLGLFSGLPQNEQQLQQQVGEQEPSKLSVSQAPAWKPVDSMVMDTPITRPSSTLHPKVAAKVQASQESLNNVPPVPALVQTSMPQSLQQQSLPLTSMPIHTKSSPGPQHGAHIWTSGLQGGTPGQPSPNTQLPLHLQNTSPLQKDALLLQQHPPGAHIQSTLRNDRPGKGGKHVTMDGNQEMSSKLSVDAQKLSEGPFGFAGHVPQVHLGQRQYIIPQEQQGLPSSHHTIHFQSPMFKNNLDVCKSPSIQSQSSLKLGTDIGTRTPPVTSAAMLYAGVVAGQPLTLSPTSASPEGQVIERLPNPMRVQGDAGHQSPSPLGLRIHQDSSRFSTADDLESHAERAPSREMLFLMEQQRLHQHLYLAQEAARNVQGNSSQDPTRNTEVSRPIIRNAHDQPRNNPVGVESGRKNSLTSQPITHNQPLNLADSDNRGADSSRVTPKSTPPAPQSPFSLPYLDRKGEPSRLPVGVTSAFMQPSPSTHRESLSHIYPDLPMGLTGQFGMVTRLPIDHLLYSSGHQPPAHLLPRASHFTGAFPPNTRFPVHDQYSDNKKGEPGHPDRGNLGSPSPNPMIRGPGIGLKQQPTRMPCDLPPNSPVGILQRYPVMWQGALALKNDNSYVQMHFIAGNRRLPNLALPQPMHTGALPPLRISQRMRLEQAQLEGVSKRMQCEEDYCILIAVACGRDQSDISMQTRALNDGFITYLLSKQAAGIVNVPYPGSEQAGFVVHIFPPCDFVDNSVAEQGSTVLMEQLRDVPHAVIIIATT